MAVVTITEVKNLAVELLGQSTPDLSLGALTTAGKIKSGELDLLALLIDECVVQSFLMMRGHWARNAFLTVNQVVSSGDLLSSSAGPVESVEFQVTGGDAPGFHPGNEMSVSYKEELDRETTNLLALRAITQIKPNVIIDGGTIYHNAVGLVVGGASVVVVTAKQPAFTRTSACQAPSSFTMAEAYGLIATEMAKDGVRSSGATYYRSLYEKEMAARGAPHAILPPTGGNNGNVDS